MKKTDAVIFDFDGVLVESVDVKTKAFAKMYNKYGPEVVKRVVTYHIENGGVSRYDKFRYYQEILLGKHFSSYDEKVLGETFSKLVKDAVVTSPWVPGAFEFLSSYYRKIALFVASGTPEEEIKEIVELRDMSHFFVSVHGAPASKRDIIKRICINNNFEKQRVLMVGDTWTDYDSALSKGIRFLGRVRDEQSPFPPDIPVIKDLRALHKYC
jgi:phosphoglycolate phosphatase-like HAD superfamily hydrolase